MIHSGNMKMFSYVFKMKAGNSRIFDRTSSRQEKLHIYNEYKNKRLRKFSVQFSRLVMSNSLWSHWLQHTRLPYPSPLPEFTQMHVHWVGDAIQPSHPLSSPSPLAFNLSQHQGLFKWVSSSHQVAKETLYAE